MNWNNFNLILKNISLNLSFLYLGGMILIIFFTWGYGDDFFILNRINDKSIIDSMVYFYNNWDGRQFSPGGFIHFFSFKYLSINLGIGFIFISWAIFLFFILRILDLNFKIRDFIITLTLFLIGLYPFYKDILFWKTGGFYVYFLVQAAGILWFYKSRFIKNHFVEFAVIFLLSLSSINIIFPIFIFFLFLFFKSIWLKDNKLIGRNFYYLIAIFLGILFVSLSPGNSIRMNSEGIVFLSFFEAIPKFLLLLYKSLNYSKYSFILGVLSASLLSFNQRISKNKVLKIAFSILILSLFSVFPFILTPSLARIRVFFSLATILFFSGCFFGSLFNYLIKSEIINVLIMLTVLFANILLFFQIKLIIPHSKKIEKREIFLLDNYNSHKDIIYSKILKPPGLVIIRSPDYNFEWNSDLVDYYKLNSYTEK